MSRFSLFALLSLVLLGFALPVVADDGEKVLNYKFGIHSSPTSGYTIDIAFSLVDETIEVTPAGKEEFPALVSQLGDDDANTAALAFLRLLKAGDAAVPAVAKALPSDNKLLTVNVSFLLAALNSKASLKALRKIDSKLLFDYLNDADIDGENRIHCAMALATFGDKKTMIALKPYMRPTDENGDVFLGVLIGAAFQKNAQILPDIEPLLRDENPGMRYMAIMAITAIKGKDAANQIISMLPDGEPMMRYSALTLLSALKHPCATEAKITALLFDKDAGVRCSAAIMLSDKKSTYALPYLLRALKDEDSQVRKGACFALIPHHELPGIDAAINNIIEEDPDPNVRQEVRESLDHEISKPSTDKGK